MSVPPDTPGSPIDDDPPAPSGEAEVLLPGWSSLVILLSLFAMISAGVLMAILRGDEAHVTPDAGGLRAYGPADFPEIDFDAPLLPAVIEAARSGEVGGFDVPPPPFSDESIFPCSECHADMDVDRTRRELGFHEEIGLHHGTEERWCLDCHDADDRDRLRLINGTLVGGQPRIVEVKGMALEAPFHALTLYTNNADQPGFIGALGTLLGDAGVNIATFHLGREAAGGEAIALVGIDEPPSEAAMQKIQALPHVRDAKLLRF